MTEEMTHLHQVVALRAEADRLARENIAVMDAHLQLLKELRAKTARILSRA